MNQPRANLFAQTIESLPFSILIQLICTQYNITTLEDLLSAFFDQDPRYRNSFGSKSQNEIALFVAKHGIDTSTIPPLTVLKRIIFHKPFLFLN